MPVTAATGHNSLKYPINWRESLGILSLLLLPARNRSRAVYELLGEHNNLGQHSRYINLGYWKNANTYDQASQALAELVGEQADLGPTDTLLDVGCGFGEQDLLWMNQWGPKQITAINITPSQISVARRKHPHPQIDYLVASATRLPFANASFSRIIALESAFHFNTRVDFFEQAARVLMPGGKIVLADTLPLQTPQTLRQKWKAWATGGLWQVPLANYYDQIAYCQKLADAGFDSIEVIDITQYVWQPFKAFAQQRVHDPEIQERVHPILRKIWSTPHGAADQLAYLIISARRKSAK